MPRFDFVSGAEFAASLTSDQKEFESCLECGAWKAAVVLAGSIVEAVLVDDLVSLGYTGNGKPDALRMDLSDVVGACFKGKILSEKARDLSSVIRQYRNLIHPGRAVRLQESVGQPEARSAQALLDIIIAEVVKHRAKTYGFTAEQIVAKLCRDRSCLAILPQLLEETRPAELERLLVEIIPREYFLSEEQDPNSEAYLASLRDCYRLVFDRADENHKKKAVAEFVRILRSSDKDTVYSYEEAFFVGADMKYLPDGDCRLVKTHMLARLKTDRAVLFMRALKGIGPYLSGEDEVRQLVHPLARLAATAVSGADDRLSDGYWEVDETLRDVYKKSIEDVANTFRRLGASGASAAELLAHILEYIDIPF